MYRPSELHNFLNEHEIRPRKGLSQNFLVDGNIVHKMVVAADITPGDSVLEIGPGPGAITQSLLQAGAHVTAVEKDALLAKALQRLQTPDHRLQIVATDILDFPLTDLPIGTKVVANLPYHLTTPILARLLAQPTHLTRIVVIVQEEVAQRIVASHGSKIYGSFSLFVQLQSCVHYAFKVGRHCFSPVPKIDSAVVCMDLHPPPVPNSDALFAFTRLAFSTRRKMLRRTLAKEYGTPTVERELEGLGLSKTARPEELPPHQFVALYRALTEQKDESNSETGE